MDFVNECYIEVMTLVKDILETRVSEKINTFVLIFDDFDFA